MLGVHQCITFSFSILYQFMHIRVLQSAQLTPFKWIVFLSGMILMISGLLNFLYFHSLNIFATRSLVTLTIRYSTRFIQVFLILLYSMIIFSHSIFYKIIFSVTIIRMLPSTRVLSALSNLTTLLLSGNVATVRRFLQFCDYLLLKTSILNL